MKTLKSLVILFTLLCFSDGSYARYLSSDPIGLDGGINTYIYALQNPVRYIDRFGLETSVITITGFGRFPHTAIHVDNGPGGAPLLYDPAGGYLPPNGEPRPNGDFFTGQNADLEKFIDFHEKRGDNVEIAKLPTTPTQESSIADNAIYIGGSAPFLCTVNSSAALGGICGIEPAFLPSTLAKEASNAECK